MILMWGVCKAIINPNIRYIPFPREFFSFSNSLHAQSIINPPADPITCGGDQLLQCLCFEFCMVHGGPIITNKESANPTVRICGANAGPVNIQKQKLIGSSFVFWDNREGYVSIAIKVWDHHIFTCDQYSLFNTHCHTFNLI